VLTAKCTKCTVYQVSAVRIYIFGDMMHRFTPHIIAADVCMVFINYHMLMFLNPFLGWSVC